MENLTNQNDPSLPLGEDSEQTAAPPHARLAQLESDPILANLPEAHREEVLARARAALAKYVPLVPLGIRTPVPYKWKAVTDQPWYSDLGIQQRERVRDDYYQKILAPRGVPREKFDAETKPGFMERTGLELRSAHRGEQPEMAAPAPPGEEPRSSTAGEKLQAAPLSLARGLLSIVKAVPDGVNVINDGLKSLYLTSHISPNMQEALNQLHPIMNGKFAQQISDSIGNLMGHLQAAKPDAIQHLDSVPSFKEDPKGWLPWTDGKRYDVSVPNLTQFLDQTVESLPAMAAALYSGSALTQTLKAIGPIRAALAARTAAGLGEGAIGALTGATGQGLPWGAIGAAQVGGQVYDAALAKLRELKGPDGQPLMADEDAQKLAGQARLKAGALAFPVAAITGGGGVAAAGLRMPKTLAMTLVRGYGIDLPPQFLQGVWNAALDNHFGQGKEGWVTPEGIGQGIQAAASMAPLGAMAAFQKYGARRSALSRTGGGEAPVTPSGATPEAVPDVSRETPAPAASATPNATVSAPPPTAGEPARTAMPEQAPPISTGARIVFLHDLGMSMDDIYKIPPEEQQRLMELETARRQAQQPTASTETAQGAEEAAQRLQPVQMGMEYDLPTPENNLAAGEIVDVEPSGPGEPLRAAVVLSAKEGTARVRVLTEEEAKGIESTQTTTGESNATDQTGTGIVRGNGDLQTPQRIQAGQPEAMPGRENQAALGSEIGPAQEGLLSTPVAPEPPAPPMGAAGEEPPLSARSGPVPPSEETGRVQPAAPSPPAGVDAEGFTERFKLATPALKKYARSLTRDPSRADDLFQETSLKLWEKRDSFQPGSNFTAWATSVMHNQHANDARSFERHGGYGEALPEDSPTGRTRTPESLQVPADQEAQADMQRAGVVDQQGRIAEVPGAELRARARAAGLGPETAQPRAVLRGPTGRESGVVAGDGPEVATRFRLVEADAPLASHTPDGRSNPAFPAELQPRDRTRATSVSQVQRIASKIDPAQLGDSRLAETGAPIVGPDGVVESGNGRVLALRSAYRSGRAGVYKRWLGDNAQEFGLARRDVMGMKNPILVRERATEMTPEQRTAFAEQANGGATARLSATEQAMQDARKVGDLMSAFRPAEDGALDNPENRAFVNKFVSEVVPAQEQGRVLAPDGTISSEGRTRIRNAVFAQAYGDPALVSRMAESAADDVRNITTGMLRAAPAMAEMDAAVASKKVADLSISKDVAAAAKIYADTKAQGRSIADRLAEAEQPALPGMTAEPISPVQKQLLSFFAENSRSAKRIGDGLRDYAQHAIEFEPRGQASLLADRAAPTKEGLLAELAGIRKEPAPPAASSEPRTNAAKPSPGERPGSAVQPELPQESRAPLSDLAGRQRDLQRQYRLAALEAMDKKDLSAEERQRAEAQRGQVGDQLRAVQQQVEQAHRQGVDEALDRLRTLYPRDAPLLRFADALENGAAGTYEGAKRIVNVSLQALDPAGVMDHEAFHDMRRWFFSPLENQALESAYQKNTRASREVIGRLNQDGRSAAASQAGASVEERMAHAFELRRQNRLTPRPIVSRLLDKLSTWMERIGNAFKGRGFTSAEDVFRAIESGRMAERGVRAEPTGTGTAAGIEQSQGPTVKPARPRKRVTLPPQSVGQKMQDFLGQPAPAAPAGTHIEPGEHRYRLPVEDPAVAGMIEHMTKFFGEDIARAAGGPETVEMWNSAARRMVRDRSMTKEKLLSRPFGKAFDSPEQVRAAEMLLEAAAEDLRPRHAALATASKEEQARTMAQTAELVRIAQSYYSAGSQEGRVLRARREGGQSLGAMRAKAIQSIIEKKLGTAQMMDAMAALATLDRAEQIAPFLKDFHKPTWWEKLNEVWVNSLFSPLSLSGNLFGNTAFILAQPFEILGAAAIGKYRGGPERIYAGEAKANIFAGLHAIPEAFQLAKYVWMTEEGRGLTPIEGPMKAIGGKGGWWIRTLGRSLLATDAFFKLIAYRQSLAELSYRTAAREGLSGHDMQARIEELLSDPPSPLHARAMLESHYRTFTLTPGAVANAAINLREAAPVLRFVVPFINTPSQILHNAAQRSPLALLTGFIPHKLSADNPRAHIAQGFWNEFKAGGIRRDLAVTRFAIGTAASATVAMLASAGYITGGGPSDPKELAVWRLGSAFPGGPRRQPYSILIGNQYVSYSRIEPFSTVIGMTASFVETYNQMTDKEAGQIAGALIGTFAENAVSKTWMQGLSDAIAAARDRERYGSSFINRTLAAFVPGTLAQTARTMDPTLRRAETLLDSIKARLPGVSQTLPARVDVKGEPVTFEGAVGPDIASPLFTSSRPGEPVANELLRLNIGIGHPPGKINGHELTPDQRQEYEQESGSRVWARLEKVMATPSYENLTDDQKDKRIHRAIQFEREGATSRMKRNHPELHGKVLKHAERQTASF